MVDCNPMYTPVEVGTKLSNEGNDLAVDLRHFKKIIMSLRYLSCIRLDTAYGVGLISKFMEAS